MAKKLGLCPNCNKEIIVNDEKKADLCPNCKEAYVVSEAITSNVSSNKKLGLCPNCNKEIIVNVEKKADLCPNCKEAYVVSEAVTIEEPSVNKGLNMEDDFSFIAKGLNLQIEENEQKEKEYQRKLDRARSFAIRERYNDALKIYEDLIDEDPGDMNGYMGIIRVVSKNYTVYEGEAIDDAINVAKKISRTDEIDVYDPDYEDYSVSRMMYLLEKENKIRRQKEEEEKRRQEEIRKKKEQEEHARRKALEEQKKKEEEARLKALEEKNKKEAQELKEGIEYYISLIDNHIKDLKIKYTPNFKKDLYAAKSLVQVKDLYYRHIDSIDEQKKIEDLEKERIRLEEEKRRKAEEEARRKAEIERKRKEEEARLKALEEERKRQEELARLKAIEDEKKRKAEEEARRKAEIERKRKEEEARLKALEEEKRRQEAYRLEQERKEKLRKEKEELDRQINADYAKALQGDVYAQYKIGWYYYHGKGVTKSYEEAFSWLEKSA